MRRIAAKVDANQQPIVDCLRKYGVSVTILSAPGIPDLLCGRGGHTYLLEVKGEAGPEGGTSHRDLTRQQTIWWATWQGHARVVRTPQEALQAVGIVTGLPSHG